jgi:hypothetical protein
MRNCAAFMVVLLMLVLASGTGWLAYKTATALLAVPTEGAFSTGGLRGLAFALTMVAATVGLLWLVLRVSRQERS